MSPGAAGLDHWRALQGARPSGSPAADEARSYCAGVLRAAGFAVTEQSFEYSHFPGSAGTPFAGALLTLGISAAWLLRQASARWAPAAALATAGALVAWLAAVCTGDGVLRLSIARRNGTNLVATRGGAAPRTWLVAHLDTKWQPVSTLWRTAGIVVLTLAVVVSVVAAFAALAGHDAGVSWKAALVAGWLGGLLVMGSVVGSRGPGALDNASGVAAVLAASQLLAATSNVGVLITDAEELGLAGARAWARDWNSAPGVALNCDSIDDAGAIRLMYSGRAAPGQPTAAMQRAASAAGDGARLMHLLPGVLTDSVALAARGWQTVTLSRGTLRTLSRIHTMTDDDAHMTGSGIPAAVQILVVAATELR